MRQRAKSLARSRLFRAAVSAVLIALILTRLDLGELGSALTTVAPGLLALAALTFLITNMVSVFKWRLIVNSMESCAGRPPVSFFNLTALFYMGLFFNNFLPTNFGGDFVRIWKLSRLTGKTHDAAASVFFDRVSSTFALLLIALPPALFQLRMLGSGPVLAVAAMFVVSLALIGLFASRGAARRLGELPALRRDPMGLRTHFKSFYEALHQFRGRPATLAAVVVGSLVYQLLHVLTVYFVALSLGIEVAPVFYFLFIPLVLAVGMIPVSLNGIGVREGAWVLLFGQVGVASADAFSMSILAFLIMTAVSLAGGIFYLADRTAPLPPKEAGRTMATEG